MYLVQSKRFFSSSTRSSLDSTIGGVKKGNKTLDLLGGMFWVSKNKIKREYCTTILHGCLYTSQVREDTAKAGYGI